VDLPLYNHRIWEKSLSLVVFSLESRGRGCPRQTPSLLNPLLSSLADRPPTSERRHPPWRPRPHLAASRAEPASPSIGTLAAPAMDAQRGQGSTDRLLIRHLAIALTQLSMTNSTQRRPLGPTLRRAVAMPPRRDRAAQTAQSDATSPCTHTHTLRSCASHHRAWRPAPDSTPPTPCPRVTQTNPGEPGFRHTRTELVRNPTEPLRHRRSPPSPWTPRTMPPLSADHDAQW
jgi:hypothetical protein